LLRHKGEKSAEEHYERAAGPNAYSVARAKSAYHGCILEADRAFNAMSMSVFRELSSDVWTGRVKDWPKFIIIGMRNSIGDHGKESGGPGLSAAACGAQAQSGKRPTTKRQ